MHSSQALATSCRQQRLEITHQSKGSLMSQQQSPWKNVPSSQDSSKTLVEETGAILAGVIASIVAIGFVGWGVDQFFVLLGRLIVISIALYMTGIVVHFWMSKIYRGGLSGREIFGAIGWPLGFLRAARSRAKIASVAQTVSQAKYSDSASVIDEDVAKLVGIMASIIAAILLVVGVTLALSSIGILIGLIVVGYAFGAVLQFWVAQSWKDGLTVNELKICLTWPFVALAYEREQAEQR